VFKVAQIQRRLAHIYRSGNNLARNVITIIVESASLFCVVLVADIIAIIAKSELQVIFGDIVRTFSHFTSAALMNPFPQLPPIIGISFGLLITRVSTTVKKSKRDDDYRMPPQVHPRDPETPRTLVDPQSPSEHIAVIIEHYNYRDSSVEFK
jgi:hypothetical protein